MAKQLINTGLTANDGTGDTLRAAFNKVNDNTNELYSALFTNNDLLAFREWAPNTSYLIEDVFYIVIEGSKLFLQVTSAYTSNSLMPDVLDTTNTFLVSQSTPITVYPIEGTRIPAGTLYAGDGSLWQSSQNFTVGEAGFDLAEQATNWTQITTAGLPGTSWVEAERGINSNNPFSSILPKVDGSGSPYVWRFSASGPVALDNTTVVGVRANRDRLWYHPSNDTWFHEKDPSTFQGANGTIGGAGGTVPPPAATDNLKFLRGDATWQTINSFNSFKPWINITSSPFTSIINEYYLINTNISTINISLPTAVGNNGAEITFKKINVNTNNAIIIPQVGQTIDGLPSKSLIFQWDILTIRSNGSNWLVLKELPSKIVIKPIHNFTRTGSTQSFNAGTLTTVVFNNNAGSSGISNVSLNTSNGTFTFSKIGNYSMSGVLDMTSATANARGLLQLVGAGANIEGYLFDSIQLCSTANISSPVKFNINFNISVVGDLLLQLTMASTATLNNISGTGGNTIISRLTITELA